MREAARALDDVSDHLGEVLRRADELLAEWSKFGAQVRGQVEHEAAAIGQVVEGAVGRVAAQGIDRAITDRLRALTLEIERLEQRTRAASRAVVEHRDNDRRILWGVVAGIVLANALLVVLLLRKPHAAAVAEPIRLDSTAAPQSAEPQGAGAGTTPSTNPVGSADPSAAGSDGAGSAASSTEAPAPSVTGPNAPSAGGAATPATGASLNRQSGAAQSATAAQQPAAAGSSPATSTTAGGAAKSATAPGAARPESPAPKASPIALPPRSGAHPRRKLP